MTDLTVGTGAIPAAGTLTGAEILVLSQSGSAKELGLSNLLYKDTNGYFSTDAGFGLRVDGGSLFVGSTYNGGWRNTTTGQGGAAVRNTGGVFTIFTGSNPGTAGTIISDMSEKMRILADGKTLINTTATSAAATTAKLQVNSEILSVGANAGVFYEDRTLTVTGTTNWAGWYATGGVTFYWNGNVNKASISQSTGAYTALSDKTKKRDFAASPYGLSHVIKLKPQLYRMKDEPDDAPLDLGLLAQDVKKVIPHAYVEHEIPGEKPFISYKDRAIIAALIGAVQELAAKVAALEAAAA